METIITAIIGLVGGGAAGAIVAGLFARKKANADVNRISSDAWKDFAIKMEARQEELDNKLKTTNRKLDRYGNRIIYLTKGIEILVNQIIKDGKTPNWNIDEWDPNSD